MKSCHRRKTKKKRRKVCWLRWTKSCGKGYPKSQDEFEGEPVLYNGAYECMVVVGVAEAAEAAADEVVLAGDVELPDSVELRFEEA